MSDTSRIHLLDLSRAELSERILRAGLAGSATAADRIARQLFHGFWRSPSEPQLAWAQIQNLSRASVAWVEHEFELHLPKLLSRTRSSDGTQKFLVGLTALRHEGETVETVVIGRGLKPGSPSARNRVTACVSSQIGCAMKCGFCLTGRQGLIRSLKPSEILGQIAALRAEGIAVTNVVFMGMGEPLHNLDAVLTVCAALTDSEAGLGLSRRDVTVSTSGLVPGIERLAESGLGVRLAVSLNASDDETRDELMPVNRKWPIETLLASAKSYAERTGTRVLFEYVLLQGLTDRDEDLDRLLAHFQTERAWAQINLIPFNAFPGAGFTSPNPERTKTMQHRLISSGITTTVRASGGPDILAACGQLREVLGNWPPSLVLRPQEAPLVSLT